MHIYDSILFRSSKHFPNANQIGRWGSVKVQSIKCYCLSYKLYLTKAFTAVCDRGTPPVYCSLLPTLYFIQSWNLSTMSHLEVLNWSEILVWNQLAESCRHVLGIVRMGGRSKKQWYGTFASNNLSLREEYVFNWCDTSATGAVINGDTRLWRVRVVICTEQLSCIIATYWGHIVWGSLCISSLVPLEHMLF